LHKRKFEALEIFPKQKNVHFRGLVQVFWSIFTLFLKVMKNENPQHTHLKEAQLSKSSNVYVPPSVPVPFSPLSSGANASNQVSPGSSAFKGF